MSYEKDNLISDLKEWVDTWVSIFNKALDAVPCPYARKAMLDDRIVYYYAKDVFEVELNLVSSGRSLNINPLPVSKDLMVIGCPAANITTKELTDLVSRVNQSKLYETFDLVALEDHPDDVEVINGEIMNNGKWALVFVQKLEKLQAASKQLEQAGYYKNWSDKNLEDVVNWRNRLR